MNMARFATLIAAVLLLHSACTHNPAHTVTLVPTGTEGCLDSGALNYTPDATISNPTMCIYAIDSVTGTYDITDTLITFGSMGPDTTFSSMTMTVTRLTANTLLFDTLLKCSACTGGGITYSKARHDFSYSSYSDPYTSNNGEGRFDGNIIHYTQRIYNSFSSYTSSHRGSGMKL